MYVTTFSTVGTIYVKLAELGYNHFYELGMAYQGSC